MISQAENRILAARRALDVAGKTKNRDVSAGHDDEDVVDLLVDLMHCCREYGSNFRSCFHNAEARFQSETVGAP